MMQYREYPPHPALAPWVACLWSARSAGAITHRVLPDNCVDILWQDRKPLGFIAGMMTSAETVVSAAPVRTLAVRFKPAGAFHFLHLPLHELTDARTDMDALWGSARANQIAEHLWDERLGERQRLALLERHLLAMLRQPPQAGVVDLALARIEGAAGALRIDTLADAVGVTRQHLASQFRARVGISAKTFARICRFRAVLDAIRSEPAGAAHIDWAQLALELGYADQSHLIHEFRAFSGWSPQAYGAQAGE